MRHDQTLEQEPTNESECSFRRLKEGELLQVRGGMTPVIIITKPPRRPQDAADILGSAGCVPTYLE